MKTLKIKAFGIARDILNNEELIISDNEIHNIADLKSLLTEKYPDFRKLRSLKIAVNLEYQDDHFLLNSMDEIAIIPPVSGG